MTFFIGVDGRLGTP